MAKFSVVLISLYIAIYDIKDHRIRNLHLLIFLLPLALSAHRASFLPSVLSILLALLTCILFRIGGGDFKLFSLLVLTQGDTVLTRQYFTLFLISISCSLAISLFFKRSLTGSIALAPSILAPFLLLYLDI
jgi:Flp pilus assembly protein protease CpaA